MPHKSNTQDHKKNDVLPPSSTVQKESHPCDEEGNSGKPDKGKAPKWLTSEILTCIFTGIIAVWTIIYSIFAGLQWQEIRGGSSDTHALAVAAKVQAEQAQAQTLKMKESLDKTDKLISKAAEQAKASDALAIQARRSADIADKGVETNIKSARSERRPWVGMKDFRCDGCTSDADATLLIGNMFGVMENTGKTPAVQMVVNAVWTDRKGSDPIPDYDSIKREMRNPYEVPSWLSADDAARISKTMELTRRYTEPAPTVLPPNAVRVLPIMGSAKMGRSRMASIEDRKIFYVVGKIAYFGTERDKQYVTKFCLMNDFGANFRHYPSGNDMN